MKNIKTKTLSAMVTVGELENGMDYVQVLPDNPSVGQVKPFCGMGRGQMLSDGSFDFVRRRSHRRLPELKLEHSSVSYGADEFDRFTFTLPRSKRGLFGRLLRMEARLAASFVDRDAWGFDFDDDIY